MPPDAPAFSAADLLYWLCFLVLPGAALFVWGKGARSPLHRRFALTALSLLGWVATLYAFDRSRDPAAVLWLGRLNFAAITLAAYLAYTFVTALAAPDDSTGKEASGTSRRWLPAATLALAAVTALTPLVDRAELVAPNGSPRHVTIFGPLFVPYLAHALGCLAAAVLLAFRAAGTARQPRRDQLLLVGAGTLATGAVSLVTNAVLPYAFADFRYTDVGALSTILFLLCVGWAVARHRLFDLRLFLRRTLVLGILLAFVAAAYSAVVVLVTDHIAGAGAGTFTRFGVLVIASAFDPLRRFLDSRVDALLFRRRPRSTASYRR